MIQKPFDQVDKADLDALVANAVKEGRTLEYKEQLPGNADGDKKEFLADVSSFANAAGGDLLFGVVEQRDGNGKTTGLPERATGLAGINDDQEIRRLDSIIQTGLAPRVAGVRMRTVGGFADGPVLLLRIPKSYAAPHMVTFKEHSRFYSRNNGGKYPLDVQEIRSAFALSESLPERVRRFRDERIARIVADETPVRLLQGPRVVLHLLPIAALDLTTRYDLSRFERRLDYLPPLAGGGPSFRYNLDGVVTYIPPENPGSHGYVQLFRSGALESTESVMLSAYPKEKLIPQGHLEGRMIYCLKEYLAALRDLEVEPPVFLMLSLTGVKGYSVPLGLFGETKGQIDRDALLLPDVLLDNLSADPADVLRPVFDGIWQAAGWRCCFNYNDEGRWEDNSSRYHSR